MAPGPAVGFPAPPGGPPVAMQPSGLLLDWALQILPVGEGVWKSWEPGLGQELPDFPTPHTERWSLPSETFWENWQVLCNNVLFWEKTTTTTTITSYFLEAWVISSIFTSFSFLPHFGFFFGNKNQQSRHRPFCQLLYKSNTSFLVVCDTFNLAGYFFSWLLLLDYYIVVFVL